MLKTSILALVAGAAVLPVQANAATFLYSFTGDTSFSFTLDSARAPDEIDNIDADNDGLFEYFGFYDVSLTSAGAPFGDVFFYTTSAFGGLSVDDFQGGSGLIIDAGGPQLFTGPVSSPSRQTGTFALTENGGQGQYTLTVTAVPEPAIWAMMIFGFGLTGSAIRRRKANVKVSYA